MAKVRTHLYVHNDKDSNYSKWESIGGDPNSHGARRFAYAAGELTLSVEVDLETGAAYADRIEGQRLNPPLRLN